MSVDIKFGDIIPISNTFQIEPELDSIESCDVDFIENLLKLDSLYHNDFLEKNLTRKSGAISKMILLAKNSKETFRFETKVGSFIVKPYLIMDRITKKIVFSMLTHVDYANYITLCNFTNKIINPKTVVVAYDKQLMESYSANFFPLFRKIVLKEVKGITLIETTNILKTVIKDITLKGKTLSAINTELTEIANEFREKKQAGWT